jgi:hypothetical protein
VFDDWSAWTWVLIAWGQLAVAYVAYEAYLRRREAEALRDEG